MGLWIEKSPGCPGLFRMLEDQANRGLADPGLVVSVDWAANFPRWKQTRVHVCVRGAGADGTNQFSEFSRGDALPGHAQNLSWDDRSCHGALLRAGWRKRAHVNRR